MNTNKGNYDDLTVIKYIGPKMQSWLREKLRVRTYQDLAALSVNQIQSQLSTDKKTVARNNIEEWIKQAKELAVETRAEDEGILSAVESADFAEGRLGRPKRANDWEEYASFVIYFEAREINGERQKRIKVFHIEEDKSKVWSELTAENFLWMLDQAGERPTSTTSQPYRSEQLEIAEVKPEPDKQPVKEARVEIKEVRLFQPPEAENPLAVGNGKSKQPRLNAGEPFSLEVLFSLGGEAAESVAKQHAKYSVNVVAKEALSKRGADLASSEPKAFVEGKLDYRVRMPEATLGPGVHQLWAMVSVQAANAVPNFLQGPSVNVL
ncbi:MAG: hypothetical protein IPM53_32610 [Anaerolineaceae bacterium]|nr:hypothetical protein [Anaerolineaceae bacterium]